MSNTVDNTYLRFTHRAKNGITYTYTFQLSSPNNFSRTDYYFETIPNDLIENLGEIERGFEDDLNIGLELTGTCKLSFNMSAITSGSEVMNEFISQLMCEHAPYTADTVFFGTVRLPLRLMVKKGSKNIFDGVMAFKTQNEITVSNGRKTIEVEFTDIVRAAGEICRTDNDTFIPYLIELIRSTNDATHVFHDVHSAAFVNRYIAPANVVHHVLMLPGYYTMITPIKLFELLGRFYALAYYILTRYLINPSPLHIIGAADAETNWVCVGGNPFYNQSGTDQNRFTDNPTRGWTFHTQDVVNSVDMMEIPPTTALNNDDLLLLAFTNIKQEDGSFLLSTIQDGFCTNGKDGGNLGTYKNLYEFVKSWSKSFYLKVTVKLDLYLPNSSFYFDVRTIFSQEPSAITGDLATQNVERNYKIKRGALASNFKVNLADATEGNESSVELNFGLENDTTLEHEISVQTGNKFVNSSDSNIVYTRAGWNFIITSANPYSTLYYDGTSTMWNDIINGQAGRMFDPKSSGIVRDHGVSSYFFKCNEKCYYQLGAGTDKVLTTKPELPDFVKLAYGGESSFDYFEDAGAWYRNEGDERKEAKFDLFNAYQHECLSTLGQSTMINQWNSIIFGQAGTEIYEITARGIGFSAANIGQLVYDATPIGVETIDNTTRYGVLTKVIENPMEGTINLTILSAKL